MFSDLASADLPVRSTTLVTAKSRNRRSRTHRLHGLPEARQHAVLLGLVRLHIAVLGSITPSTDKAFQDLGLTHLTAVEM